MRCKHLELKADVTAGATVIDKDPSNLPRLEPAKVPRWRPLLRDWYSTYHVNSISNGHGRSGPSGPLKPLKPEKPTWASF